MPGTIKIVGVSVARVRIQTVKIVSVSANRVRGALWGQNCLLGFFPLFSYLLLSLPPHIFVVSGFLTYRQPLVVASHRARGPDKSLEGLEILLEPYQENIIVVC